MKRLFLLTLSTAAIFCGLHTVDPANQKTDKHAVVEIGAKNFEQFAQAKKPFIIDIWSERCDPCKRMKPIFEKVAKNNPDYAFGSLDIQKEGELGKRLQVRSLPTFIVIKEGKEYGRIIGAVTSCAKDLSEKINECLANKKPTEIGSDIALSPQECFLKLTSLMQKPSEKDQVEELKGLLKAGLTPNMVFMEIPAMSNRPAFKLTTIYMILGTNKALLQVLIDHGADIDQVNAEIDLRINDFNKEIARMSEFKKMLKEHAEKINECPTNKTKPTPGS